MDKGNIFAALPISKMKKCAIDLKNNAETEYFALF